MGLGSLIKTTCIFDSEVLDIHRTQLGADQGQNSSSTNQNSKSFLIHTTSK